jgi:hypothetical protein
LFVDARRNACPFVGKQGSSLEVRSLGVMPFCLKIIICFFTRKKFFFLYQFAKRVEPTVLMVR